MTGRPWRLAFAVAALVASGVAARPEAQDAGGPRTVAIGDVHGSLDGFTTILRAAGLTDASGRWAGGTATLVQTGDVMDRGAAVRGAFDLLMALEKDARAAKGRVVPLLGNHEVMNLIGEVRDATPAIFASFAGADAEARREKAWKEYEELQKARARSRPGETPPGLGRTREEWLAAYPPGLVEYRQAIGPRGSYGRWLRSHAIAAQVGDAVFMHAGPLPSPDTPPIDQLNARAAQEIAKVDKVVDRLVDARLARPWFRLEDVLAVVAAEVRWINARLAAAKETGEAPDLAGIDGPLIRDASELLQIGTWSLLAPDGPMWYRGYATAPDDTIAAPVGDLFTRWNVRRIVVGHTPSRDARIRMRLDGRVFLIDTGMLTAVYKGSGSALELAGDRVTAIYADGTRTPLLPAPPSPGR